MKLFLTTIFALLFFSSQAQQITINLPHFAGKEYDWFMFKGEKQDTVARGTLDGNGQTVLNVPEEYKNWQGMSNFMLKGGGGLELILNGEHAFTASCTVEKPTVNDIFYTGSNENSFWLEQYKKQQGVLNKAGIINAAVQTYKPKDPLYKPLSKEKEKLEQQFDELQKQNVESPLYAARVRQMSNYCLGLGSRIDLTEKELKDEQRQYVREKLDFSQLWNSGLWRDLLSRWMSLEKEQPDSILVSDTKAILVGVQNRDVRMALVKRVVLLFNQYGKENLLSQLGSDLMYSISMLSPGDKAPNLYLPDSTQIVPNNSLVIFYESGCEFCEHELAQLRGNYSLLKERNLRVISISSDKEEAVFRKNADTFPWEQKICDYKGFEGVNFRNYAIVGAPTIYVIDDKGIVTGRYARLEEYLKK